MRKLSVGVAVSIGIHVCVAAWVALVMLIWPLTRPHDGPPENVTVEIVEPMAAPPVAPPPPTDVALADEVPAPVAPPNRAQATRAITKTTQTLPETAAPQTAAPTPVEPGPHTSLMTMRGPKRLDQYDLRVRPKDELVDVPHTAYVEPTPTGQLEASGGGTYRSNQGTFTAKVGKDGSVKIENSRNFHIDTRLPTKKDLGDALQNWSENDKTPQDPEKVALNNHRSTGTDTKPDSGQTAPILGGGFDVTDAFMRGKGQDPYAAKKLAFLDSTRDERVAIGTKYRAQQLAQSTQLMKKNLDRLWAATTDTAKRKTALFELWDECAETGEPAVVEGGTAARKLVVGFIRAKFPAGSETAYTASELAALNQSKRKQSKAAFAPYE